MVTERIGELAGLATAVLWSGSALVWSFTGRRIGATAVVFIRSVLAVTILACVCWLALGSPWPVSAGSRAIWLLVASGAVGAGVSDLMYFHGLVLIGPRVATLIQSLSPILASIMSYAIMGEQLGAQALVGIAMTVGGVAWVVGQRQTGGWPTRRGTFGRGVLLALAGVTLLGLSSVLTRMAMSSPDHPHALAATMVRMTAALVTLLPAVWLLRQTRATFAGLAQPRVMGLLVLGTVIGPVVGIWMNVVSLQYAQAGVAMALVATSPIVMIPMSYLAYGERPSWRAILGTLLAVAGVAVLMLR